MYIQFATCSRQTALRWIQSAYPDGGAMDTKDSIGDLLDMIESDEIKVTDPEMHGSCGLILSKNQKPDSQERAFKVLEKAGLVHTRTEEK